MQYKKLGFIRLFKDCSSQQVQCILIENRTELPNFSYCQRYVALKKQDNTQIFN